MPNVIVRIAFSLCILLAGWFLAKRKPALATMIIRMVITAMALNLLLLVSTGILHATWGELHRWSGHALTIVMWLWVMFSIGVVWQRYWPRFGAVIGRTGLLIVCIGLTLLAGISGYLGPTYTPEAGQETHNRFIVQHYFVFPILLSLSIGFFGKCIGDRKLESHPEPSC